MRPIFSFLTFTTAPKSPRAHRTKTTRGFPLDKADVIIEMLTKHIDQEDSRFDRIEEKQDKQGQDISTIKKEVALTQQRNGYINGFIALVVAALVSMFANWFGPKV